MQSFARDDWDEGPGVAEIVKRHRWLVVTLTVALAAAAYVLTSLQAPRYEATANLILGGPDRENVFANENPERRARNEIERLQSRDVAEDAAAILDGDLSAEDILNRVSVEGDDENDLVSVTAWGATPQGAADIANAVTDAYEEAARAHVSDNADRALSELESSETRLRIRIQSLDRELRRAPRDTATVAERDALVAQLAELTGRADQIAIDASLYGSGVDVVEPARPPSEPGGAGGVRNAIAGGLAGFALAVGIGWVATRRRRKADDASDAAAALDVPLLGSVPQFAAMGVTGSLPTITDPRTAAAESYQFLVAPLSARLRGLRGNTVLVTSPQPGDGKTVTALNLAVAASRDGRDVLVVDADTRLAGLSRITSTTDAIGLHELQQDPHNLVWHDKRHALEGAAGVEVVPTGSPVDDPAGFFRTGAFGEAMRRMRDHADLVIVDAPPLLTVSETWAIAEHVDAVVLVVSPGTPLEVLADVRDRLRLLATPVLGYVFNKAAPDSVRHTMYYDSYTRDAAARLESQPPMAAEEPEVLDTPVADEVEVLDAPIIDEGDDGVGDPTPDEPELGEALVPDAPEALTHTPHTPQVSWKTPPKVPLVLQNGSTS